MIGHYLGMLIFGSIEDIQYRLQDLQHAQVSIARVQELFSTTSGLVDGAAVLSPGALSISFNNVSFAYRDRSEHIGKPRSTRNGSAESPRSVGHRPTTAHTEHGAPSSALVLQHLSFRLQAGRVLGLLGRTGSGKTTIARLLFRLYDPQEGEIRLGDVDLRHARIDALRARIGLVTQDVQLFHASLRDNLTFFDPAVSDETLVATLEALGEQPTRLRILWGESPLSSIARFGRLAYPGLGEVTNQELFGWKSHSCCVNNESHGGDDLSGEQNCGPEAKRMTAASK